MGSKIDELTLPQYLRVITEGAIAVKAFEEQARLLREPQHEQQASAFAEGVAAILDKAAQETRDFLNKRPKEPTNGMRDPRINTSHIGGS